MNMDFRWIKQRALYIATVKDTRVLPAMEHHFEADPAVLFDDHVWMEWLKLVADFIAERGVYTNAVKTKIQDLQAIYSNELVQQHEQDSTVGSTDDGCGSDSAGRDGASDLADIHGDQSNGSPPPIAPGWPESAAGVGPGPAAADAHAD